MEQKIKFLLKTIKQKFHVIYFKDKTAGLTFFYKTYSNKKHSKQQIKDQRETWIVNTSLRFLEVLV